MLTIRNFESTTRPYSKLETDLIVIFAVDDKKTYRVDDEYTDKMVTRAIENIKEKKFKGDIFNAISQPAPAKFLLICPLNNIKYYEKTEAVKIAASSINTYAKNYGLSKVSILLNGGDGLNFSGPIVEGLILGSYNFDKYLTEKKDVDFQIELVINPAENEEMLHKIIRRTAIIAEGVNQTRDLVNEPSSVVTPEAVAQAAKKIAKNLGLKCIVLDDKQLRKSGYNGLLAVGGGSVNPPCMIVIQYLPKKSETDAHLALVGKGITFDSGGISLKKSEDMWQMKGDMAGAAVVLYTMKAIAELAPALRITGIIAAAENVVDAHSQNPGNIIIAKNGKSIHVDNTDAEGRLVLTDALALAGEEAATHIIDIATLTGGCVVALGDQIAGVMGDDAFVRTIIAAGKNVGEKYWQLPLPPEYRELLKIYTADINNTGGRSASAITAGLFLKEFVPENTIWAHIDIAGTSFITKKWKYYPIEGATGFGLKTLVEIATNFK